MKNLIKKLMLGSLLFFLLSSLGCMPVDTIIKDPEAYYVAQGSNLCGYTAFYMSLKYYGHDIIDTVPNVKQRIDFDDEVTDDSLIYDYISGINGAGTLTHTSLYTAADGLYYKDENGDTAKLYNTVKINKTTIGKTNATSKKQRFDDEIKSILLSDFPVLFHLARVTELGLKLTGHWITVIGYSVDEETEEITDIYFMDPNRSAHEKNRDMTDGWECEADITPSGETYTCAVQKMDYDRFMAGSWYRAPGQLYMAYWDGVYVYFGDKEE